VVIFRDKLSLKLIILIIIALAILISPGPEDAAAVDRVIKFDPPSEGEVEILIMLKDQVDTEAVAARASRFRHQFVDPETRVKEVRRQVINSLRQEAGKSQKPLLDFLKQTVVRSRAFEVESYYIVNMVYARVPVELIEEIARRPEVDSIWPNEKVELAEAQLEPVITQGSAVEWNIDHIGASDVWADLDIDGSGVVIGIIDTGVDRQHQTLETKYRGYDPLNPGAPDHAYSWFDPYHNSYSPDDQYGHGTFVAGIAVGSDPLGEQKIGVAPGAQWIAARGLDNTGVGSYDELLKAMEFMLAPTPNADGSGTPNPDMAPHIVNNSWGGPALCNPIFKTAINSWRNAGIFPVFSAGNKGPDDSSIRLPANYYESFAVGAVDSNNNLASFSGRGPGACGDFIKPNVTAPGKQVRSALSSQSGETGEYALGSGTSMAAPHVAGLAALLRQADPSLDIDLYTKTIQDTASPLTDHNYPAHPNYGFGYGLIDAYAAVSSVIDSTFSVNLSTSPDHGGTVTGEGSYETGQKAVISADAHAGFSFTGWTENNTVVSSEPIYELTVEKDRNLVANFEALEVEPSCPRYVYYLNENKKLVEVDYRYAVEKLFDNDPILMNAIRDAIHLNYVNDRAIFIKCIEGIIVDYKKALDEGKTYPEAVTELQIYGAHPQEPNKRLVINAETAELEEKEIIP